MLISIRVLNNITTHRRLTICCRGLLDSYRHQNINNFEKLLDLEGAKNTSIIIALIFLALRIHIEPAKFLENDALNTLFNMDQRLCTGYTGLDWDNSIKIEKAIAADEHNKDEKNPQERNKQLNREKHRQKWATKAKTC